MFSSFRSFVVTIVGTDHRRDHVRFVNKDFGAMVQLEREDWIDLDQPTTLNVTITKEQP